MLIDVVYKTADDPTCVGMCDRSLPPVSVSDVIKPPKYIPATISMGRLRRGRWRNDWYMFTNCSVAGGRPLNIQSDGMQRDRMA